MTNLTHTDSRTRKIKILHVLPWITGGGVEQRRRLLSKELDQNKFEQRIVCMQARPPVSSSIKDNGVSIEAIGGTWHLTDWRTILEVARVVKSWQPDVVHCAVFEGVCVGVLGGRLGGARIVVAEEIDYPITRSWRGTMLFSALTHLATKTVAVSGEVARYLSERARLPQHKIVAITNGISSPSIPEPDQLAALRENLQLPNDALVIGVAARLNNAHKRISDLLEAVALLKPRFPNLHLIVAGDGADRDLLEEQATSLGIHNVVRFVGFQAELGTIYSLMDIFVLPSEREAFGLVIVEAMLMSLPVVAVGVGGPALIVDEEKTGFLVPAYSPPDLARAIEKLLLDEDLRRAFGQAGLERARRYFSAERYVADVARFYTQLCS